MRRNNVFIEFNGESKTLTQWAKHFHLLPETISARLKRGWDIPHALTTPLPPAPLKDLSGQHFNRWTVIKPAEKFSYTDESCFLCRCDCGTERIITRSHLTTGHSKSCGCLKRDQHTKHGLSRSKIYIKWVSMIQRCENPKHESFPYYGGAGISVCERWHIFENFVSDMGDIPSPKHSIDRINPHDNYDPSNCRWATRKQQGRNRKNTVFIEFNSQKRTLKEWAEITGINYEALRHRIKRSTHPWSFADAISTPVLPRPK